MQRSVPPLMDSGARLRYERRIPVVAGNLRLVNCVQCGFLLTTGANIAGVLPNKNVVCAVKRLNDGCARVASGCDGTP